jgi:hypothetical protein
MTLLKSGKAKEFWGFMAASLVLYLLSLLFKADLKNILIIASAALFVAALLRLRRPSGE